MSQLLGQQACEGGNQAPPGQVGGNLQEVVGEMGLELLGHWIAKDARGQLAIMPRPHDP